MIFEQRREEVRGWERCLCGESELSRQQQQPVQGPLGSMGSAHWRDSQEAMGTVQVIIRTLPLREMGRCRFWAEEGHGSALDLLSIK